MVLMLCFPRVAQGKGSEAMVFLQGPWEKGAQNGSQWLLRGYMASLYSAIHKGRWDFFRYSASRA